MQAPRLAIVGAGFSAVSLLRHLRALPARPRAIHLFGADAEWATGLAYADSAGSSLLNTRAADLGIEADAIADFADWAGLQGEARDAFLPRRDYGRYLQAVLDGMLADPKLAITSHRQAVESIRRGATGFELRAGAVQVEVDAVVLATGPLPAAPLAMLSEPVRGSAAYIDDAWHAPWAEGLDPDAQVVMIGSGLSMLDHALRLRAQGHRRPLLAVSRHGWLPRPHPLGRLPGEALDAGFEQARASGSVRRMLRAMRAACAGREDWAAAFDAIRPHIPEIWGSLDDGERARFLRHLRSAWEIHRHRMARHLWDEAQGWLASGWLRLLPARILGSRLVEGGVALDLRHRADGRVETVRADRLLRATGIDGPLRAGCTPLLDSLLAQGLVSANGFGLGIAVDAGARVLAADGEAVPGLYALGTLARGCQWECTAIPELRKGAAVLARHLLAPV